MNENARPNDIVDTTDCFEAITAFQGMKNLLFVIILICLLLSQTIFWMNQIGCIDRGQCSASGCCPTPVIDPGILEAPLQTSPQIEDTADAEVQTPPAVTEPEVTIEAQADQAVAQAEELADTAAPDDIAIAQPEDKKPGLAARFKPKASQVASLIKVYNFILIISTTLYSLALLMSVKISLCGRLGGISHIARAFIFSLYALIFLMPWQSLFPGIVTGMIYTPKELFCGWDVSADSSIPHIVLYYLRFVGLWLVVMLLLFCAQLRSRRWSKTTLRRLGMLH